MSQRRAHYVTGGYWNIYFVVVSSGSVILVKPPTAKARGIDMTAHGYTRGRVFEAFLDDPGATVREIAERVGISPSSCHYHLNKLDKAGRIDMNREVGNRRGRYTQRKSAEELSRIRSAAAKKSRRKQGHAKRKRTLKTKGYGALPRMSKMELEARIDAVVAKAEKNEAEGRPAQGHDVIRVVRGKMFWMQAKARRVG